MVNDLKMTGLNNIIYFLIVRLLRSLNMQMCRKMSKGKRWHVYFLNTAGYGIFFYGALSLEVCSENTLGMN